MTILEQIEYVQKEIEELRQFAELIALPAKGETESFMTATMRLLGLLVAGTEETHRRLAALHQTIIDPRVSAALRSAVMEP